MARRHASRSAGGELVVVAAALALPALVIASGFSSTRHRRAGAAIAPAWELCVPDGCPVEFTNDTHAYPWLASTVSLVFLGAVAGLYFITGSEWQNQIVRVRPGSEGGG